MWKPNVGENNLLQSSLSSFNNKRILFTIFVLVQPYTSMQASTCRRLQPSLVLQLLLEGCYNPLALVLADMFTST